MQSDLSVVSPAESTDSLPPATRRKTKRKLWFLSVLLAAVLLVVALASLSCVNRRMGSPPGLADRQRFTDLPNYRSGVFLNREPAVVRLRRRSVPRALLRLFGKSENAPDQPLPTQPLTRDSFAAQPGPFSVRWLGHSTLVFELDGKRFLTDPVFGNAAPLTGAVPRYVESPLPREELPRLDFVVISHDHYDHLEYATVRFLRKREVPFVVPLGVGARLRGWGVPAERIYELNWDESLILDGIKITAQTARHFSGRSFSDRNQTLWTAYVFEGGGKRVFFGADGGYGAHFQAIGDTLGPFDLTCLEIDAWNERWPNSHLFPQEVLRAHEDLRGKLLLPIHWGVYDLAMHPWDESIQAVAEQASKTQVRLVTPRMGEDVNLAAPQTSSWWTPTEVRE